MVGIATDHCVRATALDAAREGFRTQVLLDLTAGVAAETTERALEELRAAGVELSGKPVVVSARPDGPAPHGPRRRRRPSGQRPSGRHELQQGPDRVPELLARSGRRAPQQAVGVVQDRRDLVRGRAAARCRAGRPPACPGCAAGSGRGPGSRAWTRTRTVASGPGPVPYPSRRAGQGQRHHHAAVRQLAETSAGHAVTLPVSVVSIRNQQDAPKHDRPPPARGRRPIML